MAFHIERAQKLNPSKKAFYCGGNRWSDDFSERKVFTTNAEATAAVTETTSVITGTRTGAGFIGASIVSE